jgi:hypothetical protein
MHQKQPPAKYALSILRLLFFFYSITILPVFKPCIFPFLWYDKKKEGGISHEND